MKHNKLTIAFYLFTALTIIQIAGLCTLPIRADLFAWFIFVLPAAAGALATKLLITQTKN